MEWIERNTLVVRFEDLPFDHEENISIIDFSHVRLLVPWKEKPLDVGALCFSRRKPKHANANHIDNEKWFVDKTTFRKERSSAIARMLEFLFIKYRTGTKSTTLYRYIGNFTKFISWCDNNNHEDVFESAYTARTCYIAYSNYLFEMVKNGTFKINTAARYQTHAREILCGIFNDETGQINAGVRKVRRSMAATNATSPPCQDKVRDAIDLYLKLFNGISDFVLKHRKYPFKLSLPKESVWVFPSSRPIAVKAERNKREEWKNGNWAWDYARGVISDPKEIEKYYAGGSVQKRDSVRIIMKSARKKLLSANDDPRDFCRRRLASLANDCFVMLFISNTGMNLAQVISLSWGDQYQIGRAHQGYKTIKYRACNKSQNFIISSNFLSLFKKYIRLRDYLLDGLDAPLFFGMDSALVNPRRISNGFSQNFNNRLRNNVGLHVSSITSREWRAYKADWLVRNTDLATTANFLQNSERTVLNYYLEGSESESAEEMTEFFEQLNSRILLKSEVSEPSYINIPAGHCSHYQSPDPEEKGKSMMPDCITPSGCLFCEHHRVIADDDDIHKLISLKYIAGEMRVTAANEKHFIQVFGPVLDRIDYILSKLIEMDSIFEKAIVRIKHSVFEEEILQPYWERKYKHLIELGIL